MVPHPGRAVPQETSGHAPLEASAGGLTAYLEEIGRKGGLKDWQFRQIIDALEILFRKVAVASWAARLVVPIDSSSLKVIIMTALRQQMENDMVLRGMVGSGDEPEGGGYRFASGYSESVG